MLVATYLYPVYSCIFSTGIYSFIVIVLVCNGTTYIRAPRLAVWDSRFDKSSETKWDTEKQRDPKFGAPFEKKARDQAKRQEGAKGELVEILNRNARRSYASLEKAMNNWCSWKTIERFLKSQKDYLTYSQNIRPLLSEGNRLKQVSFSQHVHNRWGLAPGLKILWTMR